MNNVKSFRFLIGALLLLLTTACSNHAVYQDARMIDEQGWYKKDFVSFDYEAKDTTESYDLIVDIRNGADYKYKNFWLFLRYTSPDATEYADTLECVLADNYGRWIGKSSGSMYSLPVIFMQNIRFPKIGNYHFDLVQGMREDTLQGIKEIGFRIEKYGEK